MPVTRGTAPSKRRSSARVVVNATPGTTPNNATKSIENLPYNTPSQRPARWRKRARTASTEPASHTNNTESVQEPQRFNQVAQHGQRNNAFHTSSADIAELRFSFRAADQASRVSHRRKSLNDSFSGLLVNPDHNVGEFIRKSGTQTGAAQNVLVPRSIPTLSKPKKNREGYGFSYSDTFDFDSDEYPDTEAEDEGQNQTPRPVVRTSSNTKPETIRHAAEKRPQLSFCSTASTLQDDSFNDVVVIRDIGSFHVAKPQRILPCTTATREDTIRLRLRAKALFEMFPRSGEVQAGMLCRMERMVLAEHRRAQDDQAYMLSITECTLKLKDFLLRVKEERIDTGEERRIIEEEIEWTKWILEASQTGVMHLKTPGCNCRPDWEED